MRIAICDDDPREQEQFIRALQGWDLTRSAERYVSGATFLAAAREAPPFDIVFLDIYMPDEDGIDVARTLQEISPETGIVFVTTSLEHAVDAFSLNVLHYLVKPGDNGGRDGSVSPSDRASFQEEKKDIVHCGNEQIHGVPGPGLPP